jgi:urea transport system ATP-binding protein
MLLDIDGVHTFYGHSHVLHGASLQVPEGDFACLLGRNGMGKTTLMRTIMGLNSPREGSITFRDRAIDRLKPDEIYTLGIGYVPQGRHIFPHLTVHQNLRMGLKSKRVKQSPLLDKLLDYFPVLRDRLKQKAGTLSGGEQQMLAIARALAGEVTLMLLDEPTEGVQPSIVDEFLEMLLRINKEEGLTVLLVEQNLELALSVARSYSVMEGGRIVESGAVAAIDQEAVIQKYLSV